MLMKKSNTVDEAGLKKKVASLGTGLEVKQAMVFVQEMKRSLMQREPGSPMSSILDRTIRFDEFETLDAAVPYIKRSAGITEIKVVELSIGAGGVFEGKTKDGKKVEMLVPVDKTVPGQPSLAFENI
jgi:leucyl-tRNA synthetase